TLHDLAFVEDEVYHGTRMSAELLRRCRAVAQASRVIVTPTHATKAAVVAHAARVHVVPFGADHVPSAIDAATAPPTLITIGTIEPRKNHVRLLAALRLLK